MTNLCQICGVREADFEGVVCSKCKAEVDQGNFESERKAYEEDMLSYNHKGEWCWLTGKTYCQEGWCSECVIYQSYLTDIENCGTGGIATPT